MKDFVVSIPEEKIEAFQVFMEQIQAQTHICNIEDLALLKAMQEGDQSLATETEEQQIRELILQS